LKLFRNGFSSPSSLLSSSGSDSSDIPSITDNQESKTEFWEEMPIDTVLPFDD